MAMRSFLFLAVAACASTHPAPVPSDNLSQCGPEVWGIESVRDVPLLVLGELHGMVETPAFAGDLACRLAARTPVLLALEIPRQEQPLLDAYLDLRSPANPGALLSGEFWRRPFQDGRSSQARLDLLASIRAWKQHGLPIRVVAFDDATLSGQQVRETGMAANILDARKPGERALVLVGNLHARTLPGAPWDPNIRWMSVLLAEKEPGVVTLDSRYGEGQAWVCSGPKPSDCGARPTHGQENGPAWSVERVASQRTTGYDGVFQLGPAHASPPAIGVAAAPVTNAPSAHVAP
jgi:hypothetical protein